MEDKDESLLIGYPDTITYECTKKIIEQMEKNICKIKIGQNQGTGFFCKIPFPDMNNMLPVFITNNHIINKEFLNKENAKISLDIKEEADKINIDLNNRIKYTSKEYDTTIIEIKNEDKIQNYLKLDNIIINDIINNENKNKEYEDKTIYIIHYPKGKLSVSYGVLGNITVDKIYNFIHKCCTENGSSGSPILTLNNKIVGIHKKGGYNNNYNKGTFLNFPIKEFIGLNYHKDYNIQNIDINNRNNNIIKNISGNLSKLEFYNIIANINSMQNVNTNGWDIYMNEEGYNIVQSKDKIDRLVIGVIGNINRGKSFILQALSGEALKIGTKINTIGISIKYLENKYVLLDCAGSDAPLLGENYNMLEISRDKLFTEAFRESYILRKSNVLLLVVGILSFSEQKLINKISKDLEKLLHEELKHLMVIHNLQTFEKIYEVESYINEILLKSASFNIKKEETNFGNENEEIELFYDVDCPLIKHLIYAKENSPAGNKYNKNTINTIKSLYNISSNKSIFDYKKTIIEHFYYMADKIYNGNLEKELKEDNEVLNNENKINKIINANNQELNLIDKNFLKYSLKLKYEGKEKLSLQKMVIDELAISSFINNDFIPNYEMYYNDKELIINIENPEGTNISVKRKKNKKIQDYLQCIEITAERKEEPKRDNVTYTRKKEFGKFHTLIPFTNRNYSIGKGEIDEKSNGLTRIKFPLTKIEDDE